MKKKFAKNSLISMVIIFILGLILIFSSGSIGQNKGDRAVASIGGGGMDTSQYLIIVETTTNNFRTTGSILSLLGGFGFLISGYALYKELE